MIQSNSCSFYLNVMSLLKVEMKLKMTILFVLHSVVVFNINDLSLHIIIFFYSCVLVIFNQKRLELELVKTTETVFSQEVCIGNN